MEYFLVALMLVALGIIGVVLFLRYLATHYQALRQRNRIKQINAASPYKNTCPKPHAKLTDDFRSKDRGLEKIRLERERQYGIAQKYDPLGLQKSEQETTEIVGIAEPIGRWTRFVTQQKMGWLIAMQGLKGKDTFWRNLIKAQASTSRGQNQSKGR
jgi:hypothetical protein